MPQLVSGERARTAVDQTGLNAEQRGAVIMMLTATAAATALVAPAGAGKSHTMAEFARLWTTFTGRRVIGLATSTNAARVLAHEGLAESYNIAQFLGKTEGSDELRRPVPLHQDDVLVLDEASQLATADLAMIQEAARQAGARVIATGDTAQLGAVEAGGMFRLLAREVPAAELHEVRRFDAEWERQASIRLRDGDPAAVAAYDRYGRIRRADEETACDRAAAMWLADHLRGKEVLLLAGSNAEAANLARRVQARLTQLGTLGPPRAALSDGNHAGVGDLIRARLNTEIDACGRQLTNRDTLAITAFPGPDAEVRRQRLDGTWTGTFRVPRSYLTRHAELAYAGNVHVAQGRTVDTAHLLVTGTLSRQALYVGMTRGRQANTAHVVTGNTAPPGHQPYQQATPEAVLASIMQRDHGDLSAIEQIRQVQDWASGTGHLLTLWTATVRQTLHPDIDEQIKVRLTETEAWRYDREHTRKALHQRLRAAQLAGHDVAALIDTITVAPMDRARSISSVLHHRLQRLALPDLRRDVTWAQRTPATAPPLAHELAAALDDRARALGERLAASPEPWLAHQLGVLAPAASPTLREDYTRRAGIAAAYREAAGITNPGQAVSPEPHRGNPELEAMRRVVFAALEIRDEADILRHLDRGELEARALQGERARAAAPPDVSSQFRLTAQAEADARRQAADAHIQHDHMVAASASALAAQLVTERQRLEAANARYEHWSAATHATRDTAGKATAELQRRRHAQPDGAPHPQPEDEPGVPAISWTLPLCCFWCPIVKLALVIRWAYLAEPTLFPDVIVISLDVVEHGGPDLARVAPHVLIDQLLLDRRIKRFRCRVVIAYAGVPDRRDNTLGKKAIAVPSRGILGTAVMVRHKLAYAYSRPAGGQRIIQGLEHQARAHVVIHGPADDLIRAHVDKRRQVRETRIRPDIGDIADPQLVRLRGGELAVHQIDQAADCLAVLHGRPRRRPGMHALQARGPRQAAHPPLGGDVPLLLQVPQDPLDAGPVLMPFLMQVPDPRGQLNVLLIMRRDRPLLPLVISLPRHFQHTAHENDGKAHPGRQLPLLFRHLANEREFHRFWLAKYALAFFRNAFSMLRRRTSASSSLIRVRSAGVSGASPTATASLSLSFLTQLARVDSFSPRFRAVSAIV